MRIFIATQNFDNPNLLAILFPIKEKRGSHLLLKWVIIFEMIFPNSLILGSADQYLRTSVRVESTLETNFSNLSGDIFPVISLMIRRSVSTVAPVPGKPKSTKQNTIHNSSIFFDIAGFLFNPNTNSSDPHAGWCGAVENPPATRSVINTIRRR